MDTRSLGSASRTIVVAQITVRQPISFMNIIATADVTISCIFELDTFYFR
jgi:hypothetical protein